jgi:hypothetical protein
MVTLSTPTAVGDDVGTAAWAPSAGPGFGGAGVASDPGFTGPYSGLTPTDASVVGLDVVDRAVGKWSPGESTGLPGVGVGYDPGFTGPYSELTPTSASVTGLDVEDGATAALIPAGSFRTVDGVVVDTDGDPIRDAEFLICRDGLATGTRVDDEGRFSLYQLRRKVSDFVLIGSSGRDEPDYAWYEAVSTTVGVREDEATLVFRVQKLTGLYGGSGVDFGGQLG